VWLHGWSRVLGWRPDLLAQASRRVGTAEAEAAEMGQLPEERLDDAVRRHLRFMEWLGLFAVPFVSPDTAEAVLEDPDDGRVLEDVRSEA